MAMLASYKVTKADSSLDFEALKHLVRNGEGQFIEFKLKSNHPEKIVREVVAFANAKGGMLIIGISDDKQILGLKYAAEDEFVLQKAIDEYIYPPVNYKLSTLRLPDEKEVLVFDVAESLEKPHYLKTNSNLEQHTVYYRVGDKAVKASKELREILKGQSKAKSLRFTFGDKEKILLEYLAQYGGITVQKFAEVAQINPKLASRTLVLLVLTNVLNIEPREIADLYVQV